MAQPKILINIFHPDLTRSRGNRMLSDAVLALPNATVRDLYLEYPDFKIDTQREQELLIDHDLIVFQHPMYWYSSPALLKEWEDRVLEQGFAFPPGVGDKLKGKHWVSVITAGGPVEAYRSGGYNNFTISEFLRPFQQTANLCGMVWITPLVVHSVLPEGIAGYKNICDSELEDHAGAYRLFLEEYVIE
ncbi:NAD(P)H-dependent oxidoreductase [Oligoflexia bacterium]|nr:NAD(P)H-dependent oxidoreductase [Oligoflexia bacterium]